MKDMGEKLQEMEIRQAITDTKLDSTVKEIERVAGKMHKIANSMQSIELSLQDVMKDFSIEVQKLRSDNNIEAERIRSQVKEVSKEFATKWGLVVSIFLGGLVFVKEIFLKWLP